MFLKDGSDDLWRVDHKRTRVEARRPVRCLAQEFRCVRTDAKDLSFRTR